MALSSSLSFVGIYTIATLSSRHLDNKKTWIGADFFLLFFPVIFFWKYCIDYSFFVQISKFISIWLPLRSEWSGWKKSKGHRRFIQQEIKRETNSLISYVRAGQGHTGKLTSLERTVTKAKPYSFQSTTYSPTEARLGWERSKTQV